MKIIKRKDFHINIRFTSYNQGMGFQDLKQLCIEYICGLPKTLILILLIDGNGNNTPTQVFRKIENTNNK